MKNNKSGNKNNKLDCGIDLLQVFIVVVGALVIYYLYQKHCQDVETFTETTTPAKCECDPEKQKIQGFRSLQSGATLKFEVVGDPKENKYYLHGPPYKVVTVDVGNSLTLKAKNEVDGKKQIFTKKLKNM